MESVHKIRVAMLCHFSNSKIRARLPLMSRRVENLMSKFLFSKETGYLDFALWNEGIIQCLSKSDDVELFVVSPHFGLKKKIYKYIDGTVKYIFFRGTPLFPLNYVDRLFKISQRRNYSSNRKIIENEVKIIQPDLILLVGAENPYYSISILDIDNIPIFLQCQTVYSNPQRIQLSGNVDSYRWEIEQKIFEKTLYYACNGTMYYDLIKKYNPQAVVFRRSWPSKQFPRIVYQHKKYDFVFFAHYLSMKKGFDNAIEAIAIAARIKPDIKILAIGSFDKDKHIFLDRINELGIEKNIIFQPPLAEFEDLLECVTQAQFALLPVKLDVVSGTIMEAMHLGLPIVTCKTTGTPLLNEKRKTVLISDIGDNEALAQNMIDLMDSPELAQELRTNMQIYLSEIKKNSDVSNIFIEQIRSVINHYYFGIPIPQEQLFEYHKKDE